MLHFYSPLYTYVQDDMEAIVVATTVADSHLRAERQAIDHLHGLKSLGRCPPNMQLFRVEYECTLDDLLAHGKVVELAHI